MRSAPSLMMVAALSACAGDGTGTGTATTTPTDPCAPSDEPTLEIGEGLAGYEALDEGGPFQLIHGPQGGVHLEIGLRSTGIAADDLVSGEMHGFIDGEEVASAFPRLDLRCVGDGQESYGTLLVYSDTSDDADMLDGQSTRITVDVTGTDGTVVSAEGTFTIQDTQ